MRKFSVGVIGILIISISFAFQALAQSSTGGTAPQAPLNPSSTGAVPTPAKAATTAPTTPAVVKPTAVAPKPPVAPKVATPVTPQVPAMPVTTPPAQNSNASTIIIVVAAAIAGILGAVGFKLSQLAKEKDQKDERKCLNFKKLMQDKLNEITDLKGQLNDLVEEEARKELRSAVENTGAEKILAIIETGEKEYNRLKDLYEKCIADFSLPKTTLIFLYKPEEKTILLAMKKRGFGKDKWNGIGGKLEEKESVKESLVRETKEEIKVKVKEEDMRQVATVNFSFQNNSDWNQQTHVFFTEKWKGEPVETEEMSPQWFSINSLPYESMWIDDIHWLPLAIEGKKLKASFTFNKDGSEIISKEINEI